MRIITTAWMGCVAGALSLACAGVMPVAQSAALRPGTYKFYENPSGVPNTIEGSLQILSDSVDVVSATPPCTLNRRESVNSSFSFNCFTYSILADHTSGSWRVEYTTFKRVQTTTEECVYTRTPDGREVCSKKVQHREDKDVPVRGILRLTPIASVPAKNP